jgi:hypothetical protein
MEVQILRRCAPQDDTSRSPRASGPLNVILSAAKDLLHVIPSKAKDLLLRHSRLKT